MKLKEITAGSTLPTSDLRHLKQRFTSGVCQPPCMRINPIIFSILLFSSCVTSQNGRNHRIMIRTDIPAKEIIVNNEKYPLQKGEAWLRAERNKDPLIIAVNTGDSIQKVSVKSSNSIAYIASGISTLGITFLTERKEPKRYFHQKNIYLEQKRDYIKVSRFPPLRKGTLSFNIGVPYANYLAVKGTDNRKHRAGFLGISFGTDYAYKRNTYISAQGGVAIDNELPLPFAYEYEGGRPRKAYTFFANLRYNHVLGSFETGYGLSISKFYWSKTDKLGATYITSEQRSNGLGLSLSTHYRATKNTRIGLLYQPTLFSLNGDFQSYYQHLLSIELLFKFRVFKGSRK